MIRWSRSAWRAAAWGLLMLALGLIAVVFARQPGAWQSSILALFPQHVQASLGLDDSAGEGDASHAFVVLVQAGSVDNTVAAAQYLRESLRDHALIATAKPDANLYTQLQQWYFPYRFQLLSEGTRQWLQSHTADQLASDTLKKLHQPIAADRIYPMRDDPLGFAGSWLMDRLPANMQLAEHEVVLVRDGQTEWGLVQESLISNPFAIETHQRLAESLSRFSQRFPNAVLLKSGLVFHAAEGAQIARSDISTVGLGSVICILVLVVLAFRRPRAWVFLAAVLGGALVFALSATWLVFGVVHLITLAFGSTLLGLAADYGFHVLMKWVQTGNGHQAARQVRYTLWICVLSTAIAYAALATTSMPGLVQMAVFVVAGLIGAVITVLMLAAALLPDVQPATANGSAQRFALRGYAVLAKWKSLWFLLGFVLLGATLVFQHSRGTADDIRDLNTSGPMLLGQESQVRRLLNLPDMQRYFRVQHSPSQQALADSAEWVSWLQDQHAKADMANVVIAASQMVPTLARQQSDYDLVQEKVFSADGALLRLCQQLDNDCNWASPMPPFRRDWTSAHIPHWMAERFPVLRHIDTEPLKVWLTATGSDLWSIASKRLAENPDISITQVDRVAEFTAMLAGYRQTISMILVGLLLVLAMAALMLRRIALLRALLFTLIPTLCVALLVATGNGVTLFHILGTLLVIGIAVDMVVFYDRHGLRQGTWLAASLGSATSIAAFGLLSFSQVPVLQQFGWVVLSGLATAWLLAPLVCTLCSANQESPGETIR